MLILLLGVIERSRQMKPELIVAAIAGLVAILGAGIAYKAQVSATEILSIRSTEYAREML